MKSILEQFAQGNISPQPQCFAHNSQYGRAMKCIAHNEENLLAKLNDEEKLIFQKYAAAQEEINALTAAKNLVNGYKLGVLMTAEAFLTSDDLIVGGNGYR